MWFLGRPDGPLGRFFPQVCMINETGGDGGPGRTGLRPVMNPNPQQYLSSGSTFYDVGVGGGNSGGGATNGGNGGEFDGKGSAGVAGAEATEGDGAPQGRNIIATNGLYIESNVYTTNIAVPRQYDLTFAGNTSLMWTGSFFAPNTGNYKFQITSADASFIWLGPNANTSNYTLANANANNGGIHLATSNEFISYLTSGQSYDIRLMHSQRFNSNGVFFKFGQVDDGAGTKILTEQLFDIPGTHRWVCPAGVTSVSVVAVGGGGAGYSGASADGASGGGGGGLGYKNNIVVVPGTVYTVVVGGGGVPGLGTTGSAGGNSYFNLATTVLGERGYGAGTGASAPGAGGSYVGDGGGAGGAGGNGATGDDDSGADAGGGGGAGGYSGAGGAGGGNSSVNPTAGSGGGGGGGGTSNLNLSGANDPSVVGAGGGGVGVFGSGTSGAAGTSLINSGNGTTDSANAVNPALGGYGGSGGVNGGIGGHSDWTQLQGNNPYNYAIVIPGLYPDNSASGGNYGGGGGGVEQTVASYATGGIGAVRIVWATGASFPSTNVGKGTDLTTNGKGYFFSDSTLSISGLRQRKYNGWFGNSSSYFATAVEQTNLVASLNRANTAGYSNYPGGPVYVGYTADSFAHATAGLSKKTFNIAVPTGVQAGDILIFTGRFSHGNTWGDLWGGDSPAATMQDIEVWPATVNSAVGLYQNTYSGYFADNLSSLALSAANLTQTLAKTTVIDDRGVPVSTTRQYTGWFYPRRTGQYNFYIASDDAAYVWIGNNAAAATNTNANIIHNGTHSATVKGFSANFVANTFYQVRIISGNSGGQGEHGFYWKGPETSGNTKSLTSQNWYIDNTANTTYVPTFTNLNNVSSVQVWANGNNGGSLVESSVWVNGQPSIQFFKYKVADAFDASGAQNYQVTTSFGGAVSMFAVRNVTTFNIESPPYNANYITYNRTGGYSIDSSIHDFYRPTANMLSVGVLSYSPGSANTIRMIGAITNTGYSSVTLAANNRDSIILATYKASADNLVGTTFQITALENNGNVGSQFYKRFDFF